MRVYLAWTAAIACAAFSGGVQAQLSGDDIAALRAQGEREGWTFTVSQNPATQYPLSQLCGVVQPPDWRVGARFDNRPVQRDLPATFDWRNYNGQSYCPPIRDQRSCGSCWAFAVMGAVECNIFIRDGVACDVSEQWLVSCCGLGGCSGEWPGRATNFLLCSGEYQDPWGGFGAVPEEEFPYVAWDAPCETGPYNHPWCLDTWAFVGPEWGIPTVEQLKQAIMDHGPLCVCVYAGSSFQGYSHGVFNSCPSDDINHAVVLVGWDDNQAGGVWFMRNSWGSGWGEHGYMRIKYNCSEIGFNALYVDYAGRNGLYVSPVEPLRIQGPVGGPFEDRNGAYALEYWGGQTANYTVRLAPAVPWLTLNGATDGVLAPGQTVVVSVASNANATALPRGAHLASLNFTDTSFHLGDTTRPIILSVGDGSSQYTWPLDADPGWTTEGQWAFGAPTGQPAEYGPPDPGAGYTGSNVYGYNLDGSYANDLPPTHLTSTASDCTGLYNVHLNFWRWLGVETSYCDQASVSVSTDGTHWRQIWQNDEEVADWDWTPIDFDIATIADNQPAIYLRWTMGPTDYSVRYCGWNIDDVELTGLRPSPAYAVGDLNCDGVVDFADINPFVLLLSDPDGYPLAYPDCYAINGDADRNGVVNFDDVAPFVAALAG
jgi:C1A family cysteine protease